MLRLGTIVMGAADVRRAAEFWGRPDDPDFVVLADPEGNRFCVIDTSHP
ncbi:hypothetical protein OG448_16615 [Streptomyces sp. NBC_01171]|nr:hypothetical protein OG448_16615 [Streptomyces sp. NBC_01171]